jgi:Ca2+-binding RTX toxin-like protein
MSSMNALALDLDESTLLGSRIGKFGTKIGFTSVQEASVSVSPNAVSEGNTSASTGRTLTFTVTRSGDIANFDADLNYTIGGTADSSDYTTTGTGTLHFNPGQTTASFEVTSTPDTVAESNETVTVTFQSIQSTTANGGRLIYFTTNQATGFINNDDTPAYAITVSSDVVEGNSAPGNTLTYTVTRTGDVSQAGSVDVALSGAATQGNDYTVSGLSGTNSNQLTFAANASSASFTVTTSPDTVVEADESVIATISNAQGQTGATAQGSATGRIQNDDAAPVYAITASPASVAEDGSPATITYTVTRTGDVSQAGSVEVTLGGTADGSDYTTTLSGGQVAFAASGSTTASSQTQTFTVTATPDTAVEADETVVARLGAVTGPGTVGGANSATGTIQNDDSGPVPFQFTSGPDNYTGTDAPETLSALGGPDTVSGGGGADIIYGNQNADLIYGNQGNDTVYGGQGADTAYGGQGADIVYGNLGADAIYGNLGNDALYGGRDNDVLFGGQDSDLLVGGVGDDTLTGGIGADTYQFGANSGRDLVLGFSTAQGDKLDFGGQTYTVSDDGNGGTLLTLSGGGTVALAGVAPGTVSPAFFA